MKKFLLPVKRDASGGEAPSSMPPSSATKLPKNQRAATETVAHITPVVIKIESDSGSDSAFEGSTPTAESRPKKAAKPRKVRVKSDETAERTAGAGAPPDIFFPSFPSDIEDAQNSLLSWYASDTPCACPVPVQCCCHQVSRSFRYAANKRSLPWRQQTGQNAAYGVWVSEIMLQQTRVATVIEYWNRWMSKWPSVRALAASNLDDVNAMWSGLGYYRRARMLLEVIIAEYSLNSNGVACC